METKLNGLSDEVAKRHISFMVSFHAFSFTSVNAVRTNEWRYYNSKYIDAEEKDVSRNQIDESIEWFDENEVVDSARYTFNVMS